MPDARAVLEMVAEEQKQESGILQGNLQSLMFDANLNRKPDYSLYIFNIAPVEHIRHRPPQFPKYVIRACPKGQPYVLAGTVPNIVNFKYEVSDTGAIAYNSIAGERFATDLLNPTNTSNNVWAQVGEADSWIDGGSDDLVRRGVFWSRHEVPTAEELGMARKLMERHYREVVQKAETLARDGKGREIGQEAHVAADYLGINATWHVKTSIPESCPNCGEEIKPGVAFHASSAGAMCIIDWKRAVAAGVKSKHDVPEEQRWWAEAATAAPPIPDDPAGESNRTTGRKPKIG